MTATQRFIEDAIKGGWKDAWRAYCPKCGGSGGVPPEHPCYHCDNGQTDEFLADEMVECIENIILKPAVWQAVGKTRGWVVGHFDGKPTWLEYQHRFIDHLADGKTIEEALSALEA